MGNTVEMQDIRGLDIDKLAKGFAEETYVFKADCQVSKMSGDSVRWFQKTAGTLTATAPSTITDVSPLSTPATLGVSWTRNTSYKKKFFVEGFISMEDIEDADVGALATTIRDLTISVTSAVDAHIWDIMSESQSPSDIQSFATTAVGGDQWDALNYAADIIKDLMRAKRMIKAYRYNPEGASLYLDPVGYESLVNWLISGKGSSIPGFSSEKIKSGTVMSILGLNVKVSNNVTTDYALVVVPKRATTYKERHGVTAKVIKDEMIGSNIRVMASGIAFNTDPKAIVLITDVNTA